MADEDKEKAGGTGEPGTPGEFEYKPRYIHKADHSGRAIAWSVIVPIVVLLLIGAGIWLAVVHSGESYGEVGSFETVLKQSERPLVQQNFLKNLFMPDSQHLRKLSVSRPAYIGRSDLVFPEGRHVRLVGVTNLWDVFQRAKDAGGFSPEFKMSCHDGSIHLDKVTIPDEVLISDVDMQVLGQLRLLRKMPDRSHKGEPGKIPRVPQFKYDDNETFKKYVGKVIAIAGKPVREEERWILQDEEGEWRMVLLIPEGVPELHTILELAGQNDEPLMVDALFGTEYPWKNRKDPTKSRSETRIVGEATVQSASLQRLHVGLLEDQS